MATSPRQEGTINRAYLFEKVRQEISRSMDEVHKSNIAIDLSMEASKKARSHRTSSQVS